MVRFNKVMLIAAVGIIVLFSGCTGNQEKEVTEAAQSTPVQTTVIQPTEAQTPTVPYQVRVAEVKTLQDCIVLTETKPCLLVNIEVKNNNLNSFDFKVVKEEMSSKSGKLLGTRYDKDVGLSTSCVRQSGMEFKLDAGTNKNVAMCYPIVHKGDSPVQIVEALINGQRKEYKFDLTGYGVPD